MIYTTLKKIRAHRPCENGWEKLLKHLNKTQADDEPLALTTILDSNGIDDTLWCLRSVPENDREWRLFAVWCARQVQHLMTDPRSIAALDVAERHANGMASEEELEAAWAAGAAARAAAWAAGAAARAAAEAAEAAWAAGAAARAAAEAAEAAWAAEAARAAWAAARAAAEAAEAAWAAARAAAEAAWAAWAAEAARAAWAAEAARAAQEAELRRILDTTK